MKHILFLASLLISMHGVTQSLPFFFEGDITTEDFVNFDGGTASVISNPQSAGINTSAMVAQIVRDGGEIWGGSKVVLDANLDFSMNATISMKVWTNAPVGTIVKFKLEGAGQTERDTPTTVSGGWQELSWDFTGEPTDFNEVVFMFDFGNVGDGSEESTFLFDDVNQSFAGNQIDHPVTFEDPDVNYTTTPFEGNSSLLVTDPTDITNTVAKSTKTQEASPSAGTTIGTSAGFATNIPLTLTDSQMSVRVWSPTAGTPVRLKVEDSNDPTHTCETEVNTTLAGEWETLVFDFTNQAPGTELLSVGLDMGWTYNMASIFFNFGSGPAPDEPSYYFDDVYFGIPVDAVLETQTQKVVAYPNPSNDFWTISLGNESMSVIEIYDMNGRLVSTENPHSNSFTIDLSTLEAGVYSAMIYTTYSAQKLKLVKN